mmetsp:Transcript_34865/g.81477  ORF Transcript_34865/g.81477 Transcript_34865/m.81477 type:complete len:483 (-) Transcript_34865:72-1520(-)
MGSCCSKHSTAQSSKSSLVKKTTVEDFIAENSVDDVSVADVAHYKVGAPQTTTSATTATTTTSSSPVILQAAKKHVTKAHSDHDELPLPGLCLDNSEQDLMMTRMTTTSSQRFQKQDEMRRLLKELLPQGLRGDCLLDESELKSLMRKHPAFSPRGTCWVEDMIAAFDRNGDGFIDHEEFIAWVYSFSGEDGKCHGASGFLQTMKSVNELEAVHVFLTPQDEAQMEWQTLWQLRREENSHVLTDAGLGGLDNKHLLVMSVGSSSTQVYDASGFACSFPVGMKVKSGDALEQMRSTLSQASRQGETPSPTYSHVVLINSIGYVLKPDDPLLVDLSSLVDTVTDDERDCIKGLHHAIEVAVPGASAQVLNRAKDPVTKRHKYTQLVNDFSEALAAGGGPLAKGGKYDAIVDWGGGSYKIFAGGQRIGTGVMDANHLLCSGGVLQHDRLRIAVIDIKTHVLGLLPAAKKIFIAQTGKARELALQS